MESGRQADGEEPHAEHGSGPRAARGLRRAELRQERHAPIAALADAADELHDLAVRDAAIGTHVDDGIALLRAQARRLGTRAVALTGASRRYSAPSAASVTTTGRRVSETRAAVVSGSSTGTPPVISGVVTMKMTSSTSITSTSGVMLISASGR